MAAREHLVAVGDTHQAATQLEASHVHDAGTGPIVVKFRRRVAGIPVFRGESSVVMTRERELVAITTSASSTSAGPTSPAPVVRGATPRFAVTAPGAVERALASVGVPDTVGRLVLADAAGDLELYRVRDPAPLRFTGPVAVRRVWYPAGAGLVPAYHVQALVPGATPAGFGAWTIVVSADDGRVLLRYDRLREAGGFAYRLCESPGDAVFLASSPYGGDGVPHPTGLPDGYQPAATCAQTLLTPTFADPWLPEGADTTVGNNVDAYVAICGDTEGNYLSYRSDLFDAGLGDFRGSVTDVGVFDHPYDQSQATSDRFCVDGPGTGLDADPQVAAKLVQAFALGNMLHDLTYAHGFDEAAGNMQESNYGRGGREHDRMRILTGAYGTFAAPTSDGLSPYMSLGRSGGSRANRDMALDLAVAAHEWMHLMSNRLVGDADGLMNNQGQALGEGWSDFFGLLTMVREGQDSRPANVGWTGVYGLGGYGNTAYCFPRPCTPPPPGQDQSWYFGIRRYPYTVDLGKNPLTFRFIENDVPLPAGIPHTFWLGRYDNAEIHSAGEIWASALWHCYRELLLDPRNDFATAQGKMLDYLIAGLAATPVDPTFTEARDALLAVVAAADAADLARFRAAFAARGMGAGAVSPPRGSVEMRGVIESFAASGPGLSLVSASLGDDGSGDGDGVLDVGETGSVQIVLHNTGFMDLDAVSVVVDSHPGSVSPASQALTGLAVSAGGDLLVTAPLTLLAAETYELLGLTLRFGSATAGLADTSVAFTSRVAYDVHRQSAVDDAETDLTWLDWEVGGYVGCYRDLGFARAVVGGRGVYAAPLGPCYYESTMLSPWLPVAAGATLSVTFDAAFNATLSGGAGSVDVIDDSGAALATRSFAGTTSAYPALSSYTLEVPPAHSARLLRLRLVASMDRRTDAEEGGFVVDDIAIAGTEAPVFSAAVADGATGPAGGWAPTADFTWSTDGLAVTFTDASDPWGRGLTGYAWSFGDGAASSAPNPVHTYAWPGEYLVSLFVTDAGGATNRRVELVRPEQPLEPGVRWDHPTSVGTTLFYVDVPPGVARLAITAPVQGDGYVELRAHPDGPVAIPPSYGADLYGSGDSLNGAPVATILVDSPPAGRWHLAVIGTASSVLTDVVATAVRPNAPPTASFRALTAGLEVAFTDTSTDDSAVVAWSWSFGDGTSSNERNPVHEYSVPGTYTVTLTVTDDAGATGTATQSLTALAPACAAVSGGGGGGLVLLSLLAGAWRRARESRRARETERR